MNVGNQLNPSRPSIRLYQGTSAGGNFNPIIGGGPEPYSEKRGKAATNIIKQVKYEKENHMEEIPREPVGHSLRRRTVIDASGSHQAPPAASNPYADSNPYASNPYAQQQAPAESSFMMGGSDSRQQPQNDVSQASQNTSLFLGGDASSYQQPRATRRQRGQVEAGPPEWMKAPQEGAPQHHAPRRQVIDCSPPSSTDGVGDGGRGQRRSNMQQQQGQYEAPKAASGGGLLGHDDSRSRNEPSNDQRRSMREAAELRQKARPF